MRDRTLDHDQPYQAIIAAAKAGICDVIVMASHGHSGISALLLGSVTNKVLTHSKIPVLVCRSSGQSVVNFDVISSRGARRARQVGR